MNHKKKAKLSREEWLKKKRIAERKRKEKIKSDPVKAEELRRKERERYHRKKAEGKIIPLSKMPARARKRKQKQNKINFKNYHERKKQKQRLYKEQERNDEIISSTSNQPEIYPPRIPSESINCDVIISSPISGLPENIILFSSQLRSKAVVTDRDNQNLQSCTLNLRSRKIKLGKNIVQTSDQNSLDVDNNDEAVVQAELQDLDFQQTSSPMHFSPYSPLMPPSISSIHSPIPSVAPNSPSSDISINCAELKRTFISKLRRYQKKKSSEIMSLRNTIVKMKKEKEVYRKRLERLEGAMKISPKSKIISRQKTITRKPSPRAIMIRNLVKNFLEDDENTRLAPGKQDCITRNSLKKQKRYLSDTLKNLHRKYLQSGYPPISYTTFTRFKPFWIVQLKLGNRDTCVCKQHANMDLLISSLKKNKIINENSSTEVLKSLTCENASVECYQRKCPNCKHKIIWYKEFDNSNSISYYSWDKRNKTYVKDSVEKTTKVVEKVQKRDKPVQVIKHFEKKIEPFMNHCGNIKNQYAYIKKIKENLTENECIIHMDFSENYSTKYSSEIQAVHFGSSRSQMSLHTAVIYYIIKKDNTVLHKSQSFCTVSESLRHDASAVWAHLVPILKEIKTVAPHKSVLHLISDSPSAQYRNKKIFYMISQLRVYLPDLSHVTWHYCECGHGKEAPDGVGGALKRSADRLVAFGKDINNIDSLVQSLVTTVPGVKIKTVQDFEITEKDWLLPKKLKAFSGSMKTHQVVWAKNSKALAMRSLSCLEPECLYIPIKCTHRKHLGFHSLPNETPVAHEANVSLTAKPPTDRNSINTPTIRRFKKTEAFHLVTSSSNRNEPVKSAEVSYDLGDIDYDNLIPSTSFFENINSVIISEFETENELNKEGPKGLLDDKKYIDSSDDEDYEIFPKRKKL